MRKKQRTRRGYTWAELVEVWDRWERGESQKSIGRWLGKESSSVYFQLALYGGIRPRPRRRSCRALSLSEREEISRGIAAHRSIRCIASLLGRPPSTVSREIGRNGGYDSYRASEADARAFERVRRPKRCRLIQHPRLRWMVVRKLRRKSPRFVGTDTLHSHNSLPCLELRALRQADDQPANNRNLPPLLPPFGSMSATHQPARIGFHMSMEAHPT